MILNMSPDRVHPPFVGDESQVLEGFLDFHRSTLALKCDGLSDEQLRERALPPSNLSLLGLVRHLAEVERTWFRLRLAGEVDSWIWRTADDPGADLDHVQTADVVEAFSLWQDHCERSRQLLAGVGSLDETFTLDGYGDVSVRWLLVHMVEEYARHIGHADLLRERLDGLTGA